MLINDDPLLKGSIDDLKNADEKENDDDKDDDINIDVSKDDK